MKLGVLGTGTVGQTLATKLTQLGHEVCMGSRSAGNEKAAAWTKEAGETASQGSFADAAAFGEVLMNCTSGVVSVDVLRSAGTENLDGKVLIDVSNPLDFSGGMPPSLAVSNTDSMGETLQREFPPLRVVKSLNTMSAAVMVNPSAVAGDHVVFVAGNDDDAKKTTTELLGEFGWPSPRVMDLGDISAARGLEMWLPLWLRLMGAQGTAMFNLAIAK